MPGFHEKNNISRVPLSVGLWLLCSGIMVFSLFSLPVMTTTYGLGDGLLHIISSRWGWARILGIVLGFCGIIVAKYIWGTEHIPSIISPSTEIINHSFESYVDSSGEIMERVKEILEINFSRFNSRIKSVQKNDEGEVTEYTIGAINPGHYSDEQVREKIRQSLTTSIEGTWSVVFKTKKDQATVTHIKKVDTTVHVPFVYKDNKSVFGVNPFTGDQISINWSNKSGLIVGGKPGSGKTASLRPVLAGLANHAELIIVDGKSSSALESLRKITRYFNKTTHIEDAEVLARVIAIAHAREQMLLSTFNVDNFWHIPEEKRIQSGLYPIFVIFDEAQTYFDFSSRPKKIKERMEGTIAAATTQIQKSRSAGIVGIYTTQKPSAKSIPTMIRDNCGLRVCFKVSETTQVNQTLGVGWKESGNSPIQISSNEEGKCVMEVEEEGFITLQAYYISPDDIVKYLEDKSPVPDQWEQIMSLLSPDEKANCLKIRNQWLDIISPPEEEEE